MRVLQLRYFSSRLFISLIFELFSLRQAFQVKEDPVTFVVRALGSAPPLSFPLHFMARELRSVFSPHFKTGSGAAVAVRGLESGFVFPGGGDG